MYRAHWGFERDPFRHALDVAAFHSSPTHDEALARLHYLVDGRRRLGLLLGPGGSGKTLLLDVLAEQVRRQGARVAKTSLLALDRDELLAAIAAAWGLDPRPGLATADLWRLVTDRMAEHDLLGLHSVILLDDADEATDGLLAHVIRLVQTGGANSAPTVVLAARHAGVDHLPARLLELVDLRIDLAPWNADDVAQFLEAALARVGRREAAFTPDATERLAELSRGIPRNVIQLADLALLAAAADGLEQVDTATIESVYEELGVIHQTTPGR